MARGNFGTKKKLASMALVVGTLLYIVLFLDRLYTDWSRLVVTIFSPSVSGLALLIALANYVVVGDEAGRWLKGAVLTIAIIFGIGLIMGWIGVV